MAFVLDNIPNSTEGWGPQFSTISKPTTTVDRVPYAPYQKGRYNKMKVADWTNTARITYVTKGNVTNTSMNFFEENGGDFLVVDRTLDRQKKSNNKQKTKTNRDKKKAANSRTVQQQGKSRPRKGRNQQQKKRTKRRYYGAGYGFYKQNRKYSPSVEIQPTWGEPILDIDFKVLMERNVSYNDPVEAENLDVKGRVERFNDIYESLSARKGRHLEKRWGAERVFNRASTNQDPVMDDLKSQNIGNVYATDVIIATIMTTLKSVYGWDILIKKENGNIYLDKRADSPIDYLTVNENASDPPQEKADPIYNSLKYLHNEATSINQNFSQQVLYKEPGTEIVYGEGNPFTQETCESAAYKYRKWNLGDIQLVGRAQFDAYKMVNDQVEPLLVKSLNEYDPKITHGWKKLLETLRNGVFSTQVQHNANKLSKWAIEAYLAEAYGIEIGYVSRYNPKDVNNHVILGVDFFRTNLFMSEISGFSMEKMWGTFIHIINIIREQEDGNYVLLRDPNAKILHLYKLNDEDFERAYQSA
eukprot:TRINITY_DN100_c0_g1_i1.p1 TRINITY_DN100_c0_g1~~TRINITY_DN100_c0_g1_i1.p1  ORF type:complete len:553 (+),score=138.74 TRINITY_DN100_c0_g1_i1:75-1661(+)